ncbi:hypothetical protein SASPL_145488 [Salvia splendens]|uniref:Phospholipid/glycerol acyltransferase domain-containing protein n=1 Tax=Salvia splendens TaxID=180675 RepID=A0A8X8WH60_SALSN|nr:hypothetical protein SASPL_145488 [Salvia splendens]
MCCDMLKTQSLETMGGSGSGKGKIPTVYQCDSNNRQSQTVVSEMDGTLLVGRSSFAYFALIAFNVGGILRLMLLLLAAPFSGLLYHLVSESAGIKVLIFATFAGVKVSSIESAANAVLPKHYSEDLHPETWRVFASCGRKCVLTANPRIMVEPFLQNYLGVDVILGTEISSFKGVATGLVAGNGVLVGESKAVALKKAFRDQEMPHVGLGDRDTDIPFLELCKEKYMVPPRPGTQPMRPEKLPKPVIFHDGRLVQKPTPGAPTHFPGGKGVVFVCNHRTVCDAVVVSSCLHRMTTTISYSVASFTEFISPIKTSKLTRNRAKDARLIEQILNQGKFLVMCPEGTTCREPYLLRFSALFAELTDRIVPVAISIKTGMFHGSTARGHKWLDPFFFYMNPFPVYDVTFLEMLPPHETCKTGKSSFDVANNVQKMIAETLGYKCTTLTRKDKYGMLARTDGLVNSKATT